MLCDGNISCRSTFSDFRFGGGLGFLVFGEGGVSSVPLELEELSAEDSELLVLSVLEDVVPSLQVRTKGVLLCELDQAGGEMRSGAGGKGWTSA